MDEQIAVERSLVGAVAGEQVLVRQALVGRDRCEAGRFDHERWGRRDRRQSRTSRS